MKQLTSYNRVAGDLNKLFDMLNQEVFENALSRPTITIQSTPRAFGHFSLSPDTWISVSGCTHEINIGAGTLARPIESVVATLLHEMVHYYNYVNGVQDCSRSGTYHNKRFKVSAESHGLDVSYNPQYGWTTTTANDQLIEFILEHDLSDILINRNEWDDTSTPPKGSNSRKYVCPCCHNSVRATKCVNVACMDCSSPMVFVG